MFVILFSKLSHLSDRSALDIIIDLSQKLLVVSPVQWNAINLESNAKIKHVSD